MGDPRTRILVGDALEQLRTLPAGSVRCCVTSPPYWGLRDYGNAGQLGLEPTPAEYVAKLVDVFAEVRRVLADDGTLWLNLGDSYASSPASGGVGQQEGGEHQRTPRRAYVRPDGLKPKDLVGIPWRVAFALQADGWWLRSDIIWHKPNPMPESVTDRPTKSHEHLFLLSKSARYYYDADAIREAANCTARPETSRNDGGVRGAAIRAAGLGQGHKGGSLGHNQPANGRNKRDVWTVTTKPYSGAHFAVMPPDLVEPCVKAGTATGDVVLDPFAGAGTVGVVARRLRRDFVGVEINPDYAEIARRRIEADQPMFNRPAPEEPTTDTQRQLFGVRLD